MTSPETGASDRSGTSSNDLDDLSFLNFPPDVDWSTTLVLKCDPEGGQYKLADVSQALHMVVRRNDVHNLGSTPLNYAFTISFKNERSTENFVHYLKDRRNKPLLIKNRPCLVSRIPNKTVTVSVRWVPVEMDTACIVEALRQYGTIVRTDLVRHEKPGWFHVYTGERKIHLLLKDGLDVNRLPFSLNIKGLFASVHVTDRNPKCLDCYYTGHPTEECPYEGCILYRKV